MYKYIPETLTQIYTTEPKPSVKRKAVDTNPCGGKAISKCELNHILFSMNLPTFNIVFLNLQKARDNSSETHVNIHFILKKGSL